MKEGRIFLTDEANIEHSVPANEVDKHTGDSHYDENTEEIVYECPCKPVAKNILPDNYAVIHNFL